MSDSQQSIFKTIDTQRRGTTSEEVVSQLREMIHQGQLRLGDRLPPERDLAKLLGVSRPTLRADRKSTRLNSSHANISYAVFCLKKKKARRGSVAPDARPDIPSRSPDNIQPSADVLAQG